jgi:hypothetical protein
MGYLWVEDRADQLDLGYNLTSFTKSESHGMLEAMQTEKGQRKDKERTTKARPEADFKIICSNCRIHLQDPLVLLRGPHWGP